MTNIKLKTHKQMKEYVFHPVENPTLGLEKGLSIALLGKVEGLGHLFADFNTLRDFPLLSVRRDDRGLDFVLEHEISSKAFPVAKLTAAYKRGKAAAIKRFKDLVIAKKQAAFERKRESKRKPQEAV